MTKCKSSGLHDHFILATRNMTVTALRSVASNPALRSTMQRARSNPALRASAAVSANTRLHPMPPPLPSRAFVSSVLLTRDAYESKRVAELKSELKQRGLTTSGKRTDLIQRLLEHDQNKLKVLPTAVPAKRAARTRSATTDAKTGHAHDVAPQHSAGVVGANAKGATVSHPPNMEPGQVSANFHDPSQGGVVAPDKLEPHGSAPGVPPAKAPTAPRTFEINIPYEPEPVEFQADIPLMTSYFHPEEPHFDGQYHEGDGPIAHMPKVRTVSGEETYPGGGVSHHQPMFDDHHVANGKEEEKPESLFGSAISSLWSSVQKDLGLTAEEKTAATKQAQQVGESAKGILKAARDTLNSAGITRSAGGKGSGSSSASYSTSSQSQSSSSSSSSKSDSTRAMNAEERSGLYLLGGIFAGGFLLGGLGKQSKRKSKKVHDEIKKSVDEARKEAKGVSDAELSSLVARAELALK